MNVLCIFMLIEALEDCLAWGWVHFPWIFILEWAVPITIHTAHLSTAANKVWRIHVCLYTPAVKGSAAIPLSPPSPLRYDMYASRVGCAGVCKPLSALLPSCIASHPPTTHTHTHTTTHFTGCGTPTLLSPHYHLRCSRLACVAFPNLIFVSATVSLFSHPLSIHKYPSQQKKVHWIWTNGPSPLFHLYWMNAEHDTTVLF